MRVEQFKNKNGKSIKNQFILWDDRFKYFQSYSTIIAKKDCFSKQVYLDKKSWDYSITTGKYRNIFLNETKKETEEKIKSGIYKLENLN